MYQIRRPPGQNFFCSLSPSLTNVQSSFGGVNWFSVPGIKMKGMRSGTGEYWVADIIK